MFELMEAKTENAVIKVIGVGGGGSNAVQHMLSASVEGVDFICANTDAQALKTCTIPITLQMGANITKGLGAGANPDVGRQDVYKRQPPGWPRFRCRRPCRP